MTHCQEEAVTGWIWLVCVVTVVAVVLHFVIKFW
jgi:hypothetical protein